MYAKRGSSVASSLLVSLPAKVIKLYDIAQPKLSRVPSGLYRALPRDAPTKENLWAGRSSGVRWG